MSESPQPSAKKIPSYLEHNNWEQELNFKLWVTKGARFSADQRCQRQGFWSQLSINLLSGYLITLGLAPFILKATDIGFSIDFMNLSVTGVSILSLVWGLSESSKKFDLKAHKYHTCALAVGRLYSALRRAKELPDDQKRQELNRISCEYDEILESCDNHEPLDYELFKIQKPTYFGLTGKNIAWIRTKDFIITRGAYLLIIFLPPVVIWLLFAASKPNV